MDLTFDSTIFVYAFFQIDKVKSDDKRKLCEKAHFLYESILAGKHSVIIPSIVLSEVCAAISRLTRKEERALEVTNEIRGSCVVVYETDVLIDKVLPLIAKINHTGLDALVSSFTKIYKTLLITDDRKLYDVLQDRKNQIEVEVKLLKDLSEEEI